MINFFTRNYSAIVSKNIFLKRIRFYSLLRFVTRCSANVFLPVYFQLFNIFKEKKLLSKKGDNPRIVVSLTTFPARINRLWIVIECLLHQTVLPDKIILWLSSDQFSGVLSLPKKLLKLQKRGLEVRFCQGDLRSHKKYFYALQEFPEDFIVTIDDDIIYPTDMLEQLINLSNIYPSCICCHRAFKIETVGNNLAPYVKWQLLKEGVKPSFQIFQTSGGGTLLPPGALHKEVLNKNVFMELCKYADDVWLNAMSQYNSIKIAKADSYIECLPIINFNNIALHSINISQGYNDKQIEAVRNYYLEVSKKDIFAHLFTT